MHPGASQGTRSLLAVAGSGFLHRLNPLTKLTFLLWLAVTVFLLQPGANAGLALVATGLGLAAGVGRVLLRRLAFTLGPICVALFAFHGFLVGHGAPMPFGPERFGLTISGDGLAFAARIAARLGALLAGSLLFVTTTHPAVLLKALDARGLPPAASYLVASPLLLLDPFSERAGAIRAAQQARGLDLTGSLRARIAAVPALILPLVTLALADIDHRASVLDGRGFRAHPRRTVLDPPRDTAQERWLRRGLLAALPLQILWALAWR